MRFFAGERLFSRQSIGFYVAFASVSCGGAARIDATTPTAEREEPTDLESVGPTGVETVAATPDQPGKPSDLEVSDSAAQALCDAEGYEGRCSFRPGGHDLPGGGRADILLIEDDMGSIEAELCIRPPTADVYPTLQDVGRESHQPGSSDTFEIVRFDVDEGTATVEVVWRYVEYPCTDDGDNSGPECEERVEEYRTTFVCTRDVGWEYVCEEQATE